MLLRQVVEIGSKLAISMQHIMIQTPQSALPNHPYKLSSERPTTTPKQNINGRYGFTFATLQIAALKFVIHRECASVRDSGPCIVGHY
jgi:hypothetical protein